MFELVEQSVPILIPAPDLQGTSRVKQCQRGAVRFTLWSTHSLTLSSGWLMKWWWLKKQQLLEIEAEWAGLAGPSRATQPVTTAGVDRRDNRRYGTHTHIRVRMYTGQIRQMGHLHKETKFSAPLWRHSSKALNDNGLATDETRLSDLIAPELHQIYREIVGTIQNSD